MSEEVKVKIPNALRIINLQGYLLKKMFHRHGEHFKSFFKDVKVDIANEGEKLVITLSGDDKEKMAKLERKLRAMHELCGDGECCC